MNRQELEGLLVANLAIIERIIGGLCRRYALVGDDAEEFSSWAMLKLVENDYAVLSKFRRESTLPTFLTAVLSMLFLEYRVQEWGRWRPSAAAKRAGAVAVRLETLVSRDGLRLAEAAEILRTTGETTLSHSDLGRLASTFPMRAPLRPVVTMDPPGEAMGPEQSDEVLTVQEVEAELAFVQSALNRALATLGDEDRLILRLHHYESLSVAHIARSLGLEQKPLYRRIERALVTLRRSLEREGLSQEAIRSLTNSTSEHRL